MDGGGEALSLRDIYFKKLWEEITEEKIGIYHLVMEDGGWKPRPGVMNGLEAEPWKLVGETINGLRSGTGKTRNKKKLHLKGMCKTDFWPLLK